MNFTVLAAISALPIGALVFQDMCQYCFIFYLFVMKDLFYWRAESSGKPFRHFMKKIDIFVDVNMRI